MASLVFPLNSLDSGPNPHVPLTALFLSTGANKFLPRLLEAVRRPLNLSCSLQTHLAQKNRNKHLSLHQYSTRQKRCHDASITSVFDCELLRHRAVLAGSPECCQARGTIPQNTTKFYFILHYTIMDQSITIARKTYAR